MNGLNVEPAGGKHWVNWPPRIIQ